MRLECQQPENCWPGTEGLGGEEKAKSNGQATALLD